MLGDKLDFIYFLVAGPERHVLAIVVGEVDLNVRNRKTFNLIEPEI